jgi:hypothetical protein
MLLLRGVLDYKIKVKMMEEVVGEGAEQRVQVAFFEGVAQGFYCFLGGLEELLDLG